MSFLRPPSDDEFTTLTEHQFINEMKGLMMNEIKFLWHPASRKPITDKLLLICYEGEYRGADQIYYIVGRYDGQADYFVDEREYIIENIRWWCYIGEPETE